MTCWRQIEVQFLDWKSVSVICNADYGARSENRTPRPEISCYCFYPRSLLNYVLTSQRTHLPVKLLNGVKLGDNDDDNELYDSQCMIRAWNVLAVSNMLIDVGNVGRASTLHTASHCGHSLLMMHQ